MQCRRRPRTGRSRGQTSAGAPDRLIDSRHSRYDMSSQGSMPLVRTLVESSAFLFGSASRWKEGRLVGCLSSELGCARISTPCPQRHTKSIRLLFGAGRGLVDERALWIILIGNLPRARNSVRSPWGSGCRWKHEKCREWSLSRSFGSFFMLREESIYPINGARQVTKGASIWFNGIASSFDSLDGFRRIA